MAKQLEAVCPTGVCPPISDGETCECGEIRLIDGRVGRRLHADPDEYRPDPNILVREVANVGEDREASTRRGRRGRAAGSSPPGGDDEAVDADSGGGDVD